MSDQMKCEECNGTGVAERIGGYDRPCDVCRGEGEQPTASVDAEPVAWMREGPNTGLRVFFDTDPTRGGPATPLYTEAQMQARADAARREALDRIAALEAKLAEKDALLRECGEALGPFAENIECIAFLEAADGDLVDRPPFSAGDYRKAATTLAKIKDATDAD